MIMVQGQSLEFSLGYQSINNNFFQNSRLNYHIQNKINIHSILTIYK